MIDLTFKLAGPGGATGEIILSLDPERPNVETMAFADFLRQCLYEQGTFEITANGKRIPGLMVIDMIRAKE